MTLGDSLCEQESIGDMRTLASVAENFGRQLATAALLAPRLMPEYVRYSLFAVADPHSDYAVQMKRVCELAHPSFMKAVAKLTADEQLLFTQHVIEPTKCVVLAVPEGG